jgi:hypothetical protein
MRPVPAPYKFHRYRGKDQAFGRKYAAGGTVAPDAAAAAPAASPPPAPDQANFKMPYQNSTFNDISKANPQNYNYLKTPTNYQSADQVMNSAASQNPFGGGGGGGGGGGPGPSPGPGWALTPDGSAWYNVQAINNAYNQV